MTYINWHWYRVPAYSTSIVVQLISNALHNLPKSTPHFFLPVIFSGQFPLIHMSGWMFVCLSQLRLSQCACGADKPRWIAVSESDRPTDLLVSSFRDARRQSWICTRVGVLKIQLNIELLH